MSRICAKCGGEGITVNDDYCRCPDGRLKKAQDDAIKKAVEAKAKEGPPKPLVKTSPLLEVKQGDWVKYNGYICTVLDVDVADILVSAIRKEGNPMILKDMQNKWVSGQGLKPMAIVAGDTQGAEKVAHAMEIRARYFIRKIEIDKALDAKDKKRFLELTKRELGDE